MPHSNKAKHEYASSPGLSVFEADVAMPFLPETSSQCTKCTACVSECPMGIISGDDPSAVSAGCIQCFACAKCCPAGANTNH